MAPPRPLPLDPQVHWLLGHEDQVPYAPPGEEPVCLIVLFLSASLSLSPFISLPWNTCEIPDDVPYFITPFLNPELTPHLDPFLNITMDLTRITV